MTNNIQDLHRAIDAFLTAYSCYIAAIDYVEDKEIKLHLIDKALKWFGIYGEYTKYAYYVRAASALSALRTAIEEDEELEDWFLIEKEREIQKALIDYILDMVKKREQK